MASLLPKSEGWLPTYILLVAVTSIGNAIQCYHTLSYTRRLYPGQKSSAVSPSAKGAKTDSTATVEPSSPAQSPVTPLSSRTFGTWTFVVGLVRLFAAYHINEPAWYQMQMLANLVGLVHFSLEAFVYKTMRPSGPWLAPTIVASTGLVWSFAQYGYYVR